MRRSRALLECISSGPGMVCGQLKRADVDTLPRKHSRRVAEWPRMPAQFLMKRPIAGNSFSSMMRPDRIL